MKISFEIILADKVIIKCGFAGTVGTREYPKSLDFRIAHFSLILRAGMRTLGFTVPRISCLPSAYSLMILPLAV